MGGMNTVTNTTDSTACDGTVDVNITGGTPPYTYLWSDASSQTTQTAVGLCADDYTVTVTDANGCIHTEMATVGLASGLSEMQLGTMLRIFPNPGNGQFFVQSDVASKLEYRVYSSTGQLIDAGWRNQSGRFVVDLTGQAAGLYLIEFQADGARTIERVSLLK